jgi:hypothetical protein
MITCYEATPAERDDAREAFEAHHGATIDWNNAPDRGWVEGWVSAQRQCTNRIAELDAALAEAQKDAARYALLRRGQQWSIINGIGDALRADDLDAAIDAAMQEGKR